MTGAPRPQRAGAPRFSKPYAVAARELLHTVVLDAVGDLLRSRSWSDVSMASVAAAAGVSRQTLYNAFGSRAELAGAYVMREVDAFLVAVEDAVRRDDGDLTEALASAFEVFLQAADEHPLVRTLVAGDDADELLPLVTTHGEPILTRASDRLIDVVLDGWPTLDPGDVRLIAETVVRLAISHVVLPSSSSQLSGRSVAHMLGPFIERALREQP